MFNLEGVTETFILVVVEISRERGAFVTISNCCITFDIKFENNCTFLFNLLTLTTILYFIMSHQNSLLGSKSEVISHSPLPAATLNENKNSSYNVPDTPTLIPDSEPEILEPIAIVGLSLKFPQNASNPEAFWKMMEEKRCAMTEWPIDRLNIDAFYDPEKNKGCNVRIIIHPLVTLRGVWLTSKDICTRW